MFIFLVSFSCLLDYLGKIIGLEENREATGTIRSYAVDYGLAHGPPLLPISHTRFYMLR